MHPVITPQELAALLSGPEPPTVADVRWSLTGPPGRVDYSAGHLPGAVFVDVDADLAGPPGPGGRHPLPYPAALQATLRAAGVRATTPVVAYDAADGSVAARLWWLLRWAGHRMVAVLDGGIAAWRAAGLPVTVEVPQPQAGTITVRPGGMPVLDATRAAALARAGSLLDARARPRYQGEAEPVDPRAGHIPGAINAPFSELTDAQGRWLPPHRLRELASRWGLAKTGDTALGAYCGSGINACALVLGLELAGVTTAARPVALYPGSWSQWCTDPKRPVATGSDPG
ncbi:MAG TPA: sulfurtransferase [Pseudonocardiaceae bacterium]|nr:sulfurtransferase [Pseudonocardiaceae bacterium]